MNYKSLKKIIVDYHMEKISRDELIKFIDKWQKKYKNRREQNVCKVNNN